MKRMILISLDGVNWPIIQPMLDRGLLPNLKSLIDKGAKSTLQTHSYVSSGSTWPSIHTGRHPGDHGIFFSHRQMKSGTYHVVKKQAEDIPFQAFWQVVAHHGFPTIIFDLPKAPLVGKFNGLALNSWGEEAPWYSPCYPKDLKKVIHRKFGKHPLQEFYHRRMKDKAGWFDMKEKLITATKTRMEILNWLMEEQKDWRLIVMAVNELHLGGHMFWHLIDPDSHDFDADLSAKVGDVMEKMMMQVDTDLGVLLEKYDDAAFLIISNNGMGPSNQPTQVLDGVLKKLGYMHSDQKGESGINRSSHNFVQELEDFIPLGLVQQLKKIIPRKAWNKWGRRLTHSSKEWKQSRAFPLPNDVSGAIRINLEGREPNGIVALDDYDKLCEEISHDLKSIKKLGSDEAVVLEVIKVREQFNGARVDELADLLLRWNTDTRVDGLEGAKIGEIKVKKDKRSGSHTDKGLFIWRDPKQGEILKAKDIVNDLDIYPTVLDYFDIDTGKSPLSMKDLLTSK